MTLRTRLTAAFLAVVLGPVLLGALFVGYAVNAVSRDRSAHQLDVAAGAVTSAVAMLCRQLHVTGEVLARLPAPNRAAAASDLVAADTVASVQLLDTGGSLVRSADGSPLVAVGAPPARPWAECGRAAPGTARYGGIAARVVVPAGADSPEPVELWVAARLDQPVIDRLAAATGVSITLLGGAPGEAVHTTDDTVGSSLAAAVGLAEGEVAATGAGKWVRRLEPTDSQPLPLVLAVPGAEPRGLLPLLSTVVGATGVIAILAAWRLARATTRPLAELAAAADRVAEGDLSVRVPVRAGDETGRLAATFNRMTHRTQAYVQALTASRDQLRRQLSLLGETLSSTHDLDRILQVILQTAQTATGAGSGAILLIDDGELVGHATGGYPVAGAPCPDPRRARTPVRVPVGAGLVGTVAATGEARRGQVTDVAAMLHPDEPRCRTYVVVPISAPSGVVLPGAPWPAPPTVRGVLAVYDRLGGEEFDDTDLFTLRTFAGHAGVAVDNVHAHEEAQRLSLTDPLTGLWNYRSLRGSLRREVERASRFNHRLAVLALDLDRFKEVNDVYGHPAGDAVLAEFARRIGSEIREVDMAFRQGGEEFVVMLPETDTHGATVLAHRLGMAVRESPMTIAPRGATNRSVSINVTVSIGIAVYPEHATTADGLLDAADDALYAAKAAGRDTYRVAPPRPRTPTQPGARDGGEPGASGRPRRPGVGVPAPTLPAESPAPTAELVVRAPAVVSDGDLPRAGRVRPRTGSDPDQVRDLERPPSGGAQPPRQSRGG